MTLNNTQNNPVYFCYYLPIICLHHCNHLESIFFLCLHYMCSCAIFIGHLMFHDTHAPLIYRSISPLGAFKLLSHFSLKIEL